MSAERLEGLQAEQERQESESKELAPDQERPEDQVAECEKTFEDHAALCEATDRALHDILSADKYLADIPFDISHEEVVDQIAVLKGQSITVYVTRKPLNTLRVIVPQSTATVLELKRAIRQTFDLDQKRRRRDRATKSSTYHSQQSANELGTNISWKYIWRTYYLALDSVGEPLQPLVDDRQLLSNYGVANKSVLRFVKRVKILRQNKDYQ